MTRATRTAVLVVALLGALALAPTMASAAVLGSTSVTMPASVTVGQTGVTAQITLTNQNTDSDEFAANTVCDLDDGDPCVGDPIELVPACGQLSGNACFPGKEEPDVFSASTTALGVAGTECNGMTFSVSEDPMTGALTVSPAAEEVVTLNQVGSTCKIDVTLTVTGMPTLDADDMVDGTQTLQIASATQRSGTFVHASSGTSLTKVEKAQPTIATSASGDIALGGTISDQATVAGRVNPTPGDVEFKLFGPGDTTCASPISTTSAPVAANGIATSPSFTPTQTGTYRWIAKYSGDDNNKPVSGACNDPGESVTVTPAVVVAPPVASAITIAASPGIVVGGQIFAAASVTGPAGPAAASAVLFRLYGPEDETCAGSPLFAATVVMNGQGGAASPPFTPSTAAPGVYRWIASFNGDARYLPSSTACNAPGSTVTVAPLPAQILSAGFVSRPRVGEPTFLEIAAIDPTRAITGLQARLGEPRGTSGISACRLGGFGVAIGPVRLRLPVTFLRPGRHEIVVVILSGGCRGKLTRQTRTIVVDVAGPETTRSAFAAKPAAGGEPAVRAAQSTCKNTFVRPTSKASTRLKVATAILCLVNRERAKKGLKKLTRSRVLALAAVGHSKDMLKRRYFEHAGPGGPSFQTRLGRVRYRGSSAAENIGYGSRFNAKLIVQAWMNSPPHKANILSPRSKFAGVGIAVGIPVRPQRPGSTFTMNFGSAVK